MKGRYLGLLGVSTVLAVTGGLHLEIAAGRGADRLAPDSARLQTATTYAAGINRSAKRDREQLFSGADQGRTITFQHPDLPSTTIAVRMLETVGVVRSRPAVKPKKAPAANSRHTVACEPVVSALTEVAKHLDAGRCVT